MCLATKGMLFIFRFPLLLQLLLLQRFSGLIAQQCDKEESIVGMMLQRHIFKIMRPSSSLHCLQACNSNVRCQSFNYDFSDGICELNNYTKEDKPEDFIPNFTRYYFGKARKRDIDERSSADHVCDVNAKCTNSYGSCNCTCKEGFIGDGQSCQDIDECNDGSHVCDANANCINTIGSHNCTSKERYYGDGQSRQADPCYNYHNLSDANRKSSYGTPESAICDNKLTVGWYRFVGAAGTKMPTTRVPAYRCGGDWSGWLDGAHPTVEDGEVIRTVCFSDRSAGCRDSIKISVINCGPFYVYKLTQLSHCNSRFCSTD